MPADPALAEDPLSAVLPRLMRQRELSYRALAARTRDCDRAERGLTHSHIVNLIAGRDHASIQALELLAAALEVAPEHFAEYRLALLRRALHERVVGFEQALATYHSLTASPAA